MGTVMQPVVRFLTDFSLLIWLFWAVVIPENLVESHHLNNNITKANVLTSFHHNALKAPNKKVHIIFMNHLDVGYDGVLPETGFINVILNRYFNEYFPRAIDMHRQLVAGGYSETFRYTTHPWLVSLYVDCPPNLVLSNIKLKCPNATELAAFTAAVKAGVITWHAGPMNMQPEFMDEWLFTYGLNLSHSLDERFGIKRVFRVLSQRDVPGLTKAVLPSLVRASIGGVSVGVNPTSAPPAVPSVFRWHHGTAEVIATWHPGGYPNNPGPNPGHPGGLSVKDCVTVASYPEAMCFAFRTDNSGPPESIQELLGYYEILRKEFPGAELVASNMENFMEGLQTIRNQLPLVTKEIGDTWIMGVSSDPRKTAEYRAASRALGKCIASGSCSLGDIRVWNASRFLLKMGEHTWGLPSVYDTVNWTNTAFYRASSGANYMNCTTAWVEQRTFLNLAISALGNHPVAPEVKQQVSETRPREPNLSDFHPLPPSSWSCQSPTLSMSFSPEGAIEKLVYNKTDWAGTSSLLGRFRYISYNETDFRNFGDVYNYHGTSSAGFNKVNITLYARPVSRMWPSKMTSLYQRNGGGCDMWAHMQLVDKSPIIQYGAPLDVWVRYTQRLATSTPGVDIDLTWFGKTSTRMPESLMFSFEPKLAATRRFLLSKMGQLIDPTNGVLNGSNYLHALDDEGFYYVDPAMKAGLQISSLDVALVSLITHDHGPSSYTMPLSPVTEPLQGVAFNMYNNVWDTNYILWYPYLTGDQDFRTRFSMKFVNNVGKKNVE